MNVSAAAKRAILIGSMCSLSYLAVFNSIKAVGDVRLSQWALEAQ